LKDCGLRIAKCRLPTAKSNLAVPQSAFVLTYSHYPSMTTSKATDWMDHPVIRNLVEQANILTLAERITLIKGLIPSIADDLSQREYDGLMNELRLKAERYWEAKSHPGEGRATRLVPGERELEGR